MAAPFNATGKIVIPYTLSGQTHKIEAYVRNIQAVGGTFNINTRTADDNDLAWEDAAAGLAGSLSCALGTTTTVGAAELRKKVGETWPVIATTTVTLPNTSASGVFYGQFTMTLRDKLFYPVKVIVLEGNFTAPFTSRDYTAFGGSVTLFAKQWTPAWTQVNAPYNWQVGRSDQFLNATGTFIKGTACLNRKIRRARGVA
jgi:hypothetical protein